MEQHFKFYIQTYGCRVNQYECQSIREWWNSAGGTETDAAKDADVILVSSCAVTAQAVSDARQSVRHLARLGKKMLIVTGCAAEAEYDSFKREGASFIIPQKDKHRLLGMHPLELKDSGYERQRLVFPPFQISSFYRARPVVKVQDGCSQFCTYCIVPLMRGPSRSRPVREIIAEISRLLDNGFREILISGINLRQFHSEEEHGRNFWSLLRHINRVFAPAWQGKARFRLSSVEPSQVTGSEGAETLEECKMLCPHLHLSLQSGSEAVLRRMGRSVYSPDGIASFISSVSKFWPMMGLGADILMGFPGETEEEAGETAAMLRSLPMTYAHIFTYSKRPGTKAAAMQDHLDPSEKRAHARLVRDIITLKKQEFLNRQLQVRSMRVAFDNSTAMHGVNEWYVSCRIDGDPGSLQREGHDLVRCRPLSSDGGMLRVIP